jgi:hypothetical protein
MPVSKKKYFLVFLLLFALLFLNHAFYYQNACAQPVLPADMDVKKVYQAGAGLPVGKIQSVWGDVFIIHAGMEDAYRARTGLPLFRGDTIITNQNASFNCQLKDGSIVKLAADSKLEITLSSHDPQRKSSTSSLWLIAGKAYFKIAKLDGFEPRDFKVETDLFIAGGRQADFAILILEEITEIIAFKESLLEVMSLEDPEQKIFLSEFQRAVIEGGELPSGVEIFPVEQANEFLSDFQPYSDQRLSGLTIKQMGEDEKIGDDEIKEEATDRDASMVGFP